MCACTWLCVCARVCMRLRVSAYARVGIYVHARGYECVCACAWMWVYMCIRVVMCICVSVCARMGLYVHARGYVCTRGVCVCARARVDVCLPNNINHVIFQCCKIQPQVSKLLSCKWAVNELNLKLS